jgi:hypothetical protein
VEGEKKKKMKKKELIFFKGSENELYFYNSLKMKMSILIGVTQMVSFSVSFSFLLSFSLCVRVFGDMSPSNIIFGGRTIF